MRKIFIRSYVFLTTVIIYSFIGYLIFSLFNIDLSSISVTTINVISGILVVIFGSSLAIVGIMANDSGEGGLSIGLVQFVMLSYPFVYLIGLISSISVLYSEMENKQEIAKWLASMSLIQLSFIVVPFVVVLLISQLIDYYDSRQKDKK